MSQSEVLLVFAAFTAIGLVRILRKLRKHLGEPKWRSSSRRWDVTPIGAAKISRHTGELLAVVPDLELLGPAGVIAQYVAPFRAYVVNNYGVI